MKKYKADVAHMKISIGINALSLLIDDIEMMQEDCARVGLDFLFHRLARMKNSLEEAYMQINEGFTQKEIT